MTPTPPLALPALPLYAIFRMRNRVASETLLTYTTLKEAADFMRSHGLAKIGERHHPQYSLVRWEVQ